MPAPFFSVVIVNYNGGPFLVRAVRSVLAQSERDLELLVIDNASTDGSLDALGDIADPRLRILREDTNHGFAGGNNRAVAEAKGDWIALLNPDAEAEADWLAVHREAIGRYGADTLFASVQLQAGEGGGCLDGLGDAYLGIGIPWRGGFGRSRELVPAAEHTVFGPCGAAFVIARSAYDTLGGFPESFFCYCEDVDLAFRARLAGMKTVLLPRAVIHHEGSGITGKASAFSLYHGTRNRLWVFVRCMPGWAFPLLLPLHLAATFAIGVYGLRKGRAGPTFRGLRDGLAALPRVLAERRGIQAARRGKTPAVLGAMCWNPLTLLRRQPDLRALLPRSRLD